MKNILIVEDDPPIRLMYQAKLLHSGFTVRAAENGALGLKSATENHPDLILLDIKMPIMDGATMLSLLRAEEWAADIRVIVLTNISKSEAPKELQFLNIDRYIVKVHYTPQQVVDIVKEVLRI